MLHVFEGQDAVVVVGDAVEGEVGVVVGDGINKDKEDVVEEAASEGVMRMRGLQPDHVYEVLSRSF